MDWNLKTLVQAYQTYGRTNAQWDEPAKRALTEFARARAKTLASNENWDVSVSNSCVAAMGAGCDDPMIRYLYTRLCLEWSANQQVILSSYCKAAQDMEQTQYPGIRKFYAWLRAGHAVEHVYGASANVPPELRNLQIWAHATRNLLSFLTTDKTMPPDEFFEASDEMLSSYKANTNRFATLYKEIEGAFPRDAGDIAAYQVLKGEANIEMAWHARTCDYANQVTPEGWRLFKERLNVAEEALSNAWRLDPKNHRIPSDMLRLELGQGQGRDRMELWFQRAMSLDPSNYNACYQKLVYLEPKWYGSIPDMMEFGRECYQSTNWRGEVPLIMMNAHQEVQGQYVDGVTKAEYWGRPEVWKDLKAAFDRYFELNPRSIGWYHNYAWLAYKAEDWATLNKAIPKLGPVNYSYFGGENAFNQMVALAKKHGEKP